MAIATASSIVSTGGDPVCALVSFPAARSRYKLPIEDILNKFIPALRLLHPEPATHIENVETAVRLSDDLAVEPKGDGDDEQNQKERYGNSD